MPPLPKAMRCTVFVAGAEAQVEGSARHASATSMLETCLLILYSTVLNPPATVLMPAGPATDFHSPAPTLYCASAVADTTVRERWPSP